ncbi:hypothetical protein FA95DRAFT_1506801, partial [Auriscalpium vulgare]
CIGSCIASTGPLADLDTCIVCGQPRYDPCKLAKSVRKRKFYTFPLSLSLQALFRSPKSADNMHYLDRRTAEVLAEIAENKGNIPSYEDIVHGSDYIKAVRRGDIGPDDCVVMFSMDGAQLYCSKKSECWISIFPDYSRSNTIWVRFDLSPGLRYKRRHIFPSFPVLTLLN